LQKCDYPIQGWIQIVKLSNPLCLLNIDLMTQIEVSIVCTERLVYTLYIAYDDTFIVNFGVYIM